MPLRDRLAFSTDPGRTTRVRICTVASTLPAIYKCTAGLYRVLQVQPCSSWCSGIHDVMQACTNYSILLHLQVWGVLHAGMPHFIAWAIQSAAIQERSLIVYAGQPM